jgi:tetratricopeptide (TPR) repeat protein
MACADALATDLDGLPLALELAAARATMLGPCALRERLRGRLLSLAASTVDVAPRHRSLEAAITWSYDLLTPPARRVLAELGVFRGVITLEAAKAVTELDEDALLDWLSVLTDASLVHPVDQEPPAFGMLETIRAFAERQLTADGGDDLGPRARHAAFFAELARAAEPHLWGPEQQRWFDRLEYEHDNLRVALRHFTMVGDAAAGLGLAAALAAFWEARGYVQEALAHLRQALDQFGTAGAALRAKAMFFASRLAAQRHESAAEWTLLKDSLALFRSVGDVDGEIFALSHMGVAAAQRSDVVLATDVGERSVALARAHSDPWHVAMALNNFGYTKVLHGDVGPATEALLTESLELRRALQEKRGVAVTLGSLAEMHLRRGELQAAGTRLDEMLTLGAELSHIELICVALNLRGLCRIASGETVQAKTDLRDSLRRAAAVGYWHIVGEALLGMAAVTALDGATPRAFRFATVADRILTSGGESVDERGLQAQPVEHLVMHQRIIDDVIRQAGRTLDQAMLTRIRAAALAAAVDDVVAEAIGPDPVPA